MPSQSKKENGPSIIKEVRCNGSCFPSVVTPPSILATPICACQTQDGTIERLSYWTFLQPETNPSPIVK